MTTVIDGYRFLDPISRRVMRAWQTRDGSPASVPWTPMEVPLSRARVALISSAGLARSDDEPFDQDGERRDPWWGDPSIRIIPRDVEPAAVRTYHLHIDPRPASEDLDCVLPLRRLQELVDDGVVGESAPRHPSMMGYQLRDDPVVEITAPAIGRILTEDQVDLALFVPV
jgi:D-proline reductase (dithiol) PrdB